MSFCRAAHCDHLGDYVSIKLQAEIHFKGTSGELFIYFLCETVFCFVVWIFFLLEMHQKNQLLKIIVDYCKLKFLKSFFCSVNAP